MIVAPKAVVRRCLEAAVARGFSPPFDIEDIEMWHEGGLVLKCTAHDYSGHRRRFSMWIRNEDVDA